MNNLSPYQIKLIIDLLKVKINSDIEQGFPSYALEYNAILEKIAPGSDYFNYIVERYHNHITKFKGLS